MTIVLLQKTLQSMFDVPVDVIVTTPGVMLKSLREGQCEQSMCSYVLNTRTISLPLLKLTYSVLCQARWFG